MCYVGKSVSEGGALVYALLSRYPDVSCAQGSVRAPHLQDQVQVSQCRNRGFGIWLYMYVYVLYVKLEASLRIYFIMPSLFQVFCKYW